MLYALLHINDLLGYGYVGIIVFLILTGCGLPIPEEAAIIAAGALSASGQLDPWLSLLSCIVGAVAGDSVMYWIGRHFGAAIVHKHPLWMRTLTPEREQRVEHLLKKHGAKVLLVTRFMVGLRLPIYLTAGLLKMSYPRFLLTDSICALFVVTLFFGLTYFYGGPILAWLKDAERGLTVAVVALVCVGGIYLYRRQARRAAKKDSPKKPAA
ncbi:MAG TPA: DedA family protein [Pirellulales bacterium]|jgi:membrane protein DedA with SNARE-associated domain|nr:DedA family protein [Pirellulales bacterium]